MLTQLLTALKLCLKVRNSEEPCDPELEDELDTNTFKLMDNLIDDYGVCGKAAQQCIRKARGQ